MPSIAVVCLAFLTAVLSSLTTVAARDHGNTKHTQVVAQFCTPADDYSDADRLYC
jgi:hypothetical protein